MLSKIRLIHHTNNIVLIVRILLHYITQVLSLFVSKFMIHFCIPCDFDCKFFFQGGLMISTFDYLSERSFTKDFQNLISIGNMAANLDSIISFDVVKDGIALKLTITIVLFRLFFLLHKCFNPIIFSIFNALKILTRSNWNCPSIIYSTELIFARAQFLDLFI